VSLATFAQQCVAWVEQVFAPIGFKPSGPATAALYASSGAQTYGSLSNQGWSPAAALSPGDIIVEQPGTGGAGGAGHIVAVGGVDAAGDALISQANSLGLAGGSPPTTGEFSAAAIAAGLKSGGLSVWQAPAAVQAQAAAAAEAAYAQLGGGTPVSTLASVTLPSAGSLGSAFGQTLVPGLGILGSGAGSAVTGAAASAAGAVAAGVAQGVGTGLGGAATTVGHGLADFLSVTTEDLKLWLENQAVALTVAAVVLFVLFGPVPGSSAKAASS
jgi:hypothetical protein